MYQNWEKSLSELGSRRVRVWKIIDSLCQNRIKIYFFGSLLKVTKYKFGSFNRSPIDIICYAVLKRAVRR